MERIDGRKTFELRTITVKKNYLKYAGGSWLIEMGNTKVVCSASIDNKVPPFLRNTQRGWLTAEYGMLPASCESRIEREASRGKLGGRTHEIQRLIGRALRSVIDFKALGERTIWIDCDVIQGDGGTRTASITGGFIALASLIAKAKKEGILSGNIIKNYIAAVSVGIVSGTPLLDLCYSEDSKAEVDMNIVMTGDDKLVEVQGTAEGEPFSKTELAKLLELGHKGIKQLIQLQKKHVRI
jgi:ribonuclease PH